MDSELREYLDRQFEQNRQHLERHVDARFEQNQEQIAELRSDVDARFEENQEQIAEFRNDVDSRFEKVDGQIRQTHVVIEEVRGLVQTVAEGVVAVREAQRETNQELKEDIGEVHDLLTASYRHLDQRLRVVEGM